VVVVRPGEQPGVAQGSAQGSAQDERREPPTCILCLRLARDGLSVADEALREIIVEHKERDEKLLTSLRAYDIEIMQTRRRRRGGWDTTEVVLRNLAILCVIADACQAFGLPPTRSRASRRHGVSGCYIAARALEEERQAISESAVVKAWTQYSFLLG
jgi:hypothetical protein